MLPGARTRAAQREAAPADLVAKTAVGELDGGVGGDGGEGGSGGGGGGGTGQQASSDRDGGEQQQAHEPDRALALQQGGELGALGAVAVAALVTPVATARAWAR